MFGLQGCLSTATLHRPWLPVSTAAASLVDSGSGASGGRRVVRFVLAAVEHVGESCHHLPLAKPLIFFAGGDVAAGTGEECWLDLRSPEEEPVVMRLAELCRLWDDGQMGCGEACEKALAGQGGLSKDGLPPVPLFLRLLLCVSSNKFVTVCCLMAVICCS